jgi:hypothetical protein
MTHRIAILSAAHSAARRYPSGHDESHGDVERDDAARRAFEPRPVAVARGNEKGRVERAIRYVRDAFFAARKFTDIADLNRQAHEWMVTRSADRPWVEDRARVVRDVFAEERSNLLPLTDEPFPASDRLDVEIGKTPTLASTSTTTRCRTIARSAP